MICCIKFCKYCKYCILNKCVAQYSVCAIIFIDCETGRWGVNTLYNKTNSLNRVLQLSIRHVSLNEFTCTTYNIKHSLEQKLGNYRLANAINLCIIQSPTSNWQALWSRISTFYNFIEILSSFWLICLVTLYNQSIMYFIYLDLTLFVTEINSRNIE